MSEQEDQDMAPERDPRGCKPGTNHGGGPKTEAGMARAIENLTAGQSSITHGVYAYLESATLPGCERCPCEQSCPFAHDEELNPERKCVVMSTIFGEELKALRQVDHLQGNPAFGFLITERARLAAVTAKIHLVLGEIGMFKSTEKGLDVQPLFDMWLKILGRAESLSDKLGVTPRSAYQLELKFGPGDGMDQIAEKIREFQVETVEPIEGEFEVEERE